MSLTHSVPRILGGYASDSQTRDIPKLETQDWLFFATLYRPGEELGRRSLKVLEDLNKPLLDGLNAK
ncbi:hypothetical protein AA0117_g13006 [Alternaria alternata]|uniref:Uncharacterized protein n=1 Tax=Alternaria alternata TaxID=5599 RepID=A0A4Q4MYD3_ALTAL|nr:hypothetical protein AA0117_g13006 [Alternaria alternata]